MIQGCIKIPEVSHNNRPTIPASPALIIENKVECAQPDSNDIIECIEDGQPKKYCNKLSNTTDRTKVFDVYINSQFTDVNGESIFNKGKKDKVQVGSNSPVEESYFSKCNSDGSTIHDTSVYIEVKDKALEKIEIENNIICIQGDHSSVSSCPRNGMQYKRCNLIKNSNETPVIVTVDIEVSHVNDTGSEVFQSVYPKDIPIGPQSTYQMSYFTNCDVDNNLDEVENAKYVKIIKDNTKNTPEKVKTTKETPRLDGLQIQGLTLFDPLPVGRCSLECDFNNPQSHCFVTTLPVTKKEKVQYQMGISKLNEILSKKEKVEPETLLESLGIKVNSTCNISTFNFSNGRYIADGNNCGFKTQLLPGLDLVGNWEQSLSMKHLAEEKNEAVLTFDSGPFIWFEGKDPSRIANINKRLAGDLLELELTQDGIYLSLPNACLVSRIIEK
jgi:hypothetical protein